MHVAIARHDRKREAANKLQRGGRRDRGGQSRGYVMIGRALIFSGRIDTKDLSEILDVDAHPVASPVETPDQEHPAFGQGVEFFWNSLEVRFGDQFACRDIHTDRGRKREGGELVLRNAGKRR